jgi:tetratricopeptide (TPR) repeat protein
LFMAGRNEQAALILERAGEIEPDNLETLLFLGNAYFTLEADERAIEVWQEYVEAAGGPDQAGRVPQLIEQAEARLKGETLTEGAPASLAGIVRPSRQSKSPKERASPKRGAVRPSLPAACRQ